MSNRSNQHIKAQKKGKKRDNNVCQLCGSVENVEGHHIIEYQYGGAPNEDNIISVCHSCHNKIHKGIIDIFKF